MVSNPKAANRTVAPQENRDSTASRKDGIDQLLLTDAYSAVSREEASKMMHDFTEVMHDQGFPWRVYSAEQHPKRLHELEAIKRLEQGKPVEFRPFVSRQLEVTIDSLDSLSPAGALGSGYEAPSRSETLMNPGFLSLEAPLGKATVVHDLSEFKLLHQLSIPAPAAKPETASGDPTQRAVTDLAKLSTQQGIQGWRFIDSANPPSKASVFWQTIKGAASGAALGAALGTVVGAPISLWTNTWLPFAGLAGAGAAWFALQKGRENCNEFSKGQSLNALEALHRLSNGEEVTLQRTQLKTVGLPIAGKFTWYTDYGQAATIDNFDDLTSLAQIHGEASHPENARKHLR